MVALEAVCKHFGKEVHPESEWIYMQKEPSIFTVCEILYKERLNKLKLSVFSVTSHQSPNWRTRKGKFWRSRIGISLCICSSLAASRSPFQRRWKKYFFPSKPCLRIKANHRFSSIFIHFPQSYPPQQGAFQETFGPTAFRCRILWSFGIVFVPTRQESLNMVPRIWVSSPHQQVRMPWPYSLFQFMEYLGSMVLCFKETNS